MELSGYYNPWLVALSYAIAAIASYVALGLSPLRAVAIGPRRPGEPSGILPAAVALGTGIWATHFTGMAAFHLHGPTIGYRWDVTVLSLIVAVVFTGIGFAALSILPDPREAALIAGIPMGSGILSMHYLGMMAMTGNMEQRFRSDLVLLSGVIALVASIAALWLATAQSRFVRRWVAALMMGAAICGMHYTGMRAAVFSEPDHSAELFLSPAQAQILR